MSKGGREISKEWRQLDGIGQAMPLAVRAEGWRTPLRPPLKSVSNSKKCPNQHLWVGPSAAETQVRVGYEVPENALLAAGTGLLTPQVQKLHQAYFPICCCLLLLTAMIAATGSLQHLQQNVCFVLGKKKKKKKSRFYCFVLHSITQCDSVIPPGFIIWVPFARA